MAFLDQYTSRWAQIFGRDQLDERIKDYVTAISKLIWQRQMIFIAATLLSAYYFDPLSSFMLYGAVVVTEFLDLLLARSVKNWTKSDYKKTMRLLAWIVLDTILSAGAISVFVVNMAIQNDGTGYFTPLFFLFAASLFAIMNNAQMKGVLAIRIGIYLLAFAFIALKDIILYNPPISSAPWLQFFTIAFVLYFIVDVSLVSYSQYQQRLENMEQIKRENERTKAALEVKSQFLSTVSHELRTPLTSIKGALDLINTGALGSVPSELQGVLGIAGKNSARLATLIDDLLDLQKIEAGEMVFNFERLNVRDLVEEALEANQAYAERFKITFETAFPKQEFFVDGDHARLMQVMANLLSNALKFSFEGGVVKVSVVGDGDRVRIAVTDQGVGIPEGAKEKVFGKFTQVDSSDVRRVGGTGLGMSITRQIVERHNGIVDYESELGNGSTFFIELGKKAPGDSSSPDLQGEPKAA